MSFYYYNEILKPIICVYEAEPHGKRNRYTTIMAFSAYEAPALLDLICEGGKYTNKDFVYTFDVKKSLLQVIDRNSGKEVLCREVDSGHLMDTLVNFVDVDLPLEYGEGF